MRFRTGSAVIRLLTPVLVDISMNLGNQARHPRNIVFILSDDEDVEAFDFMLQMKAWLDAHCTVLENYFVTASPCRRLRTSVSKSQATHNTGVQARAQGNVVT